MHAPEHMRASRAAFLKMALEAYFADVRADGREMLTITVLWACGDVVEIDVEEHGGPEMVAVVGYSL